MLGSEMPAGPRAAWDFLPVQLSPVLLNGWACLEVGVSWIVSVGRGFVCYHGSICTAAAAAAVGSGSAEAAEWAAGSLELGFPQPRCQGWVRGLTCLSNGR